MFYDSIMTNGDTSYLQVFITDKEPHPTKFI